MNRSAFFTRLRRRDSGIFGTSLSQGQVEGIDALLDAGAALPLHHMANVLAQTYHETGGRMSPVRETFADSDQEAINRLERAWKRGQLKWVKTPYWRDGWFGRGAIQLTHKANYAKFGITDPTDAMRLDVSARVAVEGMRDGKFTGKKLSDYVFPADLAKPPASNPRRIVNGRDGTDDKVAGYHRAFAAALAEGDWRPSGPVRAPERPVERPSAPAAPSAPANPFTALLRLLSGIFGGKA